MRKIVMMAAAMTALSMPAIASAQAWQCSVPGNLPRPHPEGPSDDQPRRVVPTTGYTLALTWTPEFCAGRGGDGRADALQCSGRNGRFGFTLHGLWPDGRGNNQWPQYCKNAALLPERVVRQNLCVTPSVQLMQHEWAKHGTCMPGKPADYFNRSRAMYQKLRFPDMAALSRRNGLTVGDLADAMAQANRGLRADMVRVTTRRDGSLNEMWLCVDRRFAYTRCAANSGGARPGERLKIRPAI